MHKMLVRSALAGFTAMSLVALAPAAFAEVIAYKARAAIVVPVPAPASGALASPFKGEATITDAQAADLASGKWYFNIHTAANKGGEIRGQVVKLPK